MFSKYQLENLRGTHHLSDIGVDGRIILKGILNKYGARL
jgi:hypothetical protein